MRSKRMWVAQTAAIAAAVWLPLAASAQKVERCEGPKGRITYSNEGCPPGTRVARGLDGSPPVVTHESDAAAKSGQASGTIARVEKPLDMTEAELREADVEFRRAQRARCEGLARQLRYARDDAENGPPSARASAELSLRRLQEDYSAQCPRTR
jgi:hypothetical protein